MHTHTMHSSYAPAHATPEIQPRLWHIQSDPWGLFERAECGFTGSQSSHKATKSAVGVGDAWHISTACLCKLCRLATYLDLPESPDLCVISVYLEGSRGTPRAWVRVDPRNLSRAREHTVSVVGVGDAWCT
jgi:hypothetical protein